MTEDAEMVTELGVVVVSRSGLCCVLGFFVSSLSFWLNAGLPYVQRGGKGSRATGGGQWKFDLRAVRAWLEARKAQRDTAAGTSTTAPNTGEESIDEARARRLRAMADLSELARDEARKDLISATDAMAGWRDRIIAARARLLAMP